jgi:hypothetical protein
MPSQTTSAWTMVGPRGRKRHPDESVDEPAKLIEQEPVEIEKETPSDESRPVERIDENNTSETPAFEE